MHLKLVHECILCGMLCQTALARDVHLSRIHGKEYQHGEWQKICGDEVITEYVRLVDVNGWHSPKETLREVPSDPAELCRWLYPICLRMVKFKHPEAALFSPPGDLSQQALYTEFHFRAAKASVAIERFQRLKTDEAKALLMAKALAMPNCAPGYAEQQFRGFKLESCS